MNTVSSEKLAKLKEKIALMLNKAENTPYPAEAQAFQEHAERLMVRYGITAAQLDADLSMVNGKTEEIVEVKFTIGGTYRVQEFMGFAAICHAWQGVTVLKQVTRPGHVAYVIGHESDVEQVIRLGQSLLIQLKLARAQWWKSVKADMWYLSDNEAHLERRTYSLNWMYAVAARIRELFKEESAEAGSGTDLVLANRQSQVEEWRDEKYNNLRTHRAQTKTGSHAAWAAGARDGAKADLGLGGKLDQAKAKQLS